MTDSASSKTAEVRRLAKLVKQSLSKEAPDIGDIPRRAPIIAREVLCKEGCITLLNDVLDELLSDVNARVADRGCRSMMTRPSVMYNGYLDKFENRDDDHRIAS